MKMTTAIIGIGLSVSVATAAQAGTIIVDSKDDIFLAGQSSVPATANPFPIQTAYNDDNGAGLLPVSIHVTPGEVLNLTAVASPNYSCGVGCGVATAAGQGGASDIAGYGNVGSYVGPSEFALLGEYNIAGTSPFYIGDGGVFTVPTGATKLYFGIADTFGFNGFPGTYNDNQGYIAIAGVPEPSTWAILIMGMGMMGFVLRKRRALAPV